MKNTDITVEYSLHHTRGKPVQPHHIRSLGYGWTNVSTTAHEMWELITNDGHATSARLTGDHRHSDNFVSRQVFMVDVDNGMTIDQLLENKNYNELAWGFYVTPSHTSDNHRFRIVFITENPVNDHEHARRVFKQLTLMFPGCDSVCHDATRIFYGTEACEIQEVLGNVITNDTVRWIISRMEPPPKPVFSPREFSNDYHPNRVPKRILDLIASMRPGDRSHKACKVGGMAHYLPEELKNEVEELLVAAGCDKTAVRSFRKYSK